MRDEFNSTIKQQLAARVAFHCSNPACHRPTSGPQTEPDKVINIGIAAHITAASSRGPRYEPKLSAVERSSIQNGIWLCQTCAKLVDDDVKRYSVNVLHNWKLRAERAALQAVESGANLTYSDFYSEPHDWIDYLQAVSKHLQNWHIPPELSSIITWNTVAVPVEQYIRLRTQFKYSLFHTTKAPVDSFSQHNLHDVCLSHRNLLLLGEAGIGKSSFIRYLCRKTAKNTLSKLNSKRLRRQLRIPVIVKLIDYGPNRLTDLIITQLRTFGVLVNQQQFEPILDRIDFLFLLDGIDEVREAWRTDLLNEIQVMYSRYSRQKFVATARKQPSLPLLRGFHAYELETLEKEAITLFARHYLGKSAQHFLLRIQNFDLVP